MYDIDMAIYNEETGYLHLLGYIDEVSSAFKYRVDPVIYWGA